MLVCSHCQSCETFIDMTCSQCGFNQMSKQFDWIKVKLKNLQNQGNISLNDLIVMHSSRTAKMSLKKSE